MANHKNNDQGEQEVLLVGSGFQIVGNVSGLGLCVFDGTIEGSLVSDDVKINVGGKFIGELTCKRLDADGSISGKVNVEDVIFRSNAQIQAVLSYSKMTMESGAHFDGELHCLKSSIDDPEEWVSMNLPDDIVAKLRVARVKLLNAQDGSVAPKWARLLNDRLEIKRSYAKPDADNGLVLRITVDDNWYLVKISELV